MKNSILFFLLFISINLFSQVQENMIMDRFNMNAFNPAYVGSEGREVSFTSRSAWKGISQSPKTNYFYYSGNPKKNLSFGASVISNKVFIDTRTQYSIDASYRLNLNEGSNLFLGVKAGASSKKTDLDGLSRITNVSNPAISVDNDVTYPLFGLGALYKTKKFYFSVSIPNMLNPEKFVDDDSTISSERPNTYFLSGTSLNLGGLFETKFNPFVSARIIPEGENQIHYGTTLDFKNTIEIGSGYKSTGFINLILILKTKFGFTIAYAYDYPSPEENPAIARSGSEFFIKFKF